MRPPEPLTGNHDFSEFDCGQPELTSWLHNHALQAQGSGSARTFVVCTDRVIGYYSLTVGSVETLEAPKRVAKGMGRYPIPVILLARLAVDQEFHACGIGTGMLKDAVRRVLSISEHTGIRAVLTHPIDEDAKQFYAYFGFEPSPMGERQLFLMLKDARRLL